MVGFSRRGFGILGRGVWGTERSHRLTEIANFYAKQVFRYTREIQASESVGLPTYLQTKALQARGRLAESDATVERVPEGERDHHLDKEAEAMYTEISAYRTSRKQRGRI